MFKQVRHKLSYSHKQASVELVEPPNGFSEIHAMENKAEAQTPE